MAQTVTEVPEASAEGKIKTIYNDIKSTFRSPFVPLVFRVLAQYPDYLEVAWRGLKPNVQTIYFEVRADELRSLAVERTARLGKSSSPTSADQIAPTLRVFHYVSPKVFLAIAALRAATAGQQPRLTELPRDAKRQIAPGLPDSIPEIQTLDPDGADERVQAIFDDIKATLGADVVNSVYRALAQWPDYLESAWQAWKANLGSQEYRQLERDLRWMADDAITALPYRMELYPHTLRHAGLSDHDLDAVQSTLQTFYRLLSGLVAATSFFLVGIEGREAAQNSPFPPKVL